MKHLIYILAFCLLSNLILAQTTTENYLKTTAYKKPVKTQGEIDALQDDDKIESITYFDGLGRPVQSIAKQAGGHYEDLVTPILYDEFGRQLKDYLPYSRPASSLNFDLSLLPDVNGAILPLNTQYQGKYGDDLMGVVNPYSEKALEASPLNRVLEQAPREATGPWAPATPSGWNTLPIPTIPTIPAMPITITWSITMFRIPTTIQNRPIWSMWAIMQRMSYTRR